LTSRPAPQVSRFLADASVHCDQSPPGRCIWEARSFRSLELRRHSLGFDVIPA
jgi:hypothetical protein